MQNHVQSMKPRVKMDDLTRRKVIRSVSQAKSLPEQRKPLLAASPAHGSALRDDTRAYSAACKSSALELWSEP